MFNRLLISYFFLFQIIQLKALADSPTKTLIDDINPVLGANYLEILSDNYTSVDNDLWWAMFNTNQTPLYQFDYIYELSNTTSKRSIFLENRRVKVQHSTIGDNGLKIQGLAQPSKTYFSLENYHNQDFFSLAYPLPSNLKIHNFTYNFSLNDNLMLSFSPIGTELKSFSPLFNQPKTNFISRFSLRNPLYQLIEQGGINIDLKLNDNLSLFSGYYTGELKENRLFDQLLEDDSNSLVNQLKFQLDDRLNLEFLYIYSHHESHLNTGTGTKRSQLRLNSPIVANSYGINSRLKITPNFSIGGWFGLTEAYIKDLGEARISNYAFTLGISDITKPEDFLGIMIGQEPQLIGTNGFSIEGEKSDQYNAFLGEIYYYYPINENLFITPSLKIRKELNDGNIQDNFIFNLRSQIKFDNNLLLIPSLTIKKEFENSKITNNFIFNIKAQMKF